MTEEGPKRGWLSRKFGTDHAEAIERLEDTVGSQGRDLQKLQFVIDQLTAANEKLHDNLTDARQLRKRDKLQQRKKLEQLTAESTKLEERNRSLAAASVNLETHVGKLATEAAAVKRVLKSEKSRRNADAKALNAAELARDDLGQKLQRVSGALEKANVELGEARRDAMEKGAERTRERAALGEERRVAKQKHDGKISQYQERIDKLSGELREGETVADKQREELEHADSEIDSKAKALSEARAERSKVEEVLSATKAQLTHARAAVHKALHELAESKEQSRAQERAATERMRVLAHIGRWAAVTTGEFLHRVFGQGSVLAWRTWATCTSHDGPTQWPSSLSDSPEAIEVVLRDLGLGNEVQLKKQGPGYLLRFRPKSEDEAATSLWMAPFVAALLAAATRRPIRPGLVRSRDDGSRVVTLEPLEHA